MDKRKNKETAIVTCDRCGKCCMSPWVPATQEDMERWKREEKKQILSAIEHSKALWAGDIVVSVADGSTLSNCQFLRREGNHYSCIIYEDRPMICSRFQPGSSELCSLFKHSD